jgi:hypothetical protein
VSFQGILQGADSLPNASTCWSSSDSYVPLGRNSIFLLLEYLAAGFIGAEEEGMWDPVLVISQTFHFSYEFSLSVFQLPVVTEAVYLAEVGCGRFLRPHIPTSNLPS